MALLLDSIAGVGSLQALTQFGKTETFSAHTPALLSFSSSTYALRLSCSPIGTSLDIERSKKRATSQKASRAGHESSNSSVTSVSAVAADTFAEPSGRSSSNDTSSLKSRLLRLVAGLDRGLAASDENARDVEDAAKELELVGEDVDLTADLWRMQGKWRLAYSSGFLSGSLGGQRPGPPIGRLPLNVGQVYQRVDVASRELDNIVDLKVSPPWPLPPLDVTATLAHSFETFGTAGIRITFENTSVKAGGPLRELPPFSLPQLPDFLKGPSTRARSGEFETTFLEDDVRISRGDRGELRVFVKVE
eukprot:jgi/Mesen1/4686/ME000241S03722